VASSTSLPRVRLLLSFSGDCASVGVGIFSGDRRWRSSVCFLSGTGGEACLCRGEADIDSVRRRMEEAATFRSFCRKKGRGRTPGIERDCNRLLVLGRRWIHFRLPGPTAQRRSSTRAGRATQAAAPVSAAETAAASGLEPLPRAPR